MKKQNHIIFTGGGTLGHVIPNIPLISHYQQKGWSVSYIGSKSGVERVKIESLGVSYYPIRTGKLRRYFDLQNFLDLFNVLIAIFQCFFILLRARPSILFSKGGYVALPPVIAAWVFRIPIVIHESDMTPGLTTKISKYFAHRVCVSFESALKFFNPSITVWTGLPVRNTVFNANRKKGLLLTSFSGDRPVLLVFGGSLGAAFLNKFVRENIQNTNLCSFDVINICGKGQLDHQVKASNYVQIETLGSEFLDVMQSADLVITRGGATSLFELLAMKKIHIVVPLSKKSSRGDQIDNAKYFAELGVSLFVEEENCNWNSMQKLIKLSLDEQISTLHKMNTMEFSLATNKVVDVIDSVHF
jgi:UDP-N-acetylglucosamine--N-acetylmuramyl-(pentapeptide) pyrophosphoryl-undecaprenol N-acetylglucosamine transferase